MAALRRRTSQRHRRKIDALPQPENVRPIEGRVDARHRLERIAAAIDNLDPQRRQVYVLAEIQGLRPAEIAELIGCKLNTVYSRLRRARAELSAALARAGLDEAVPPTPSRSRSHGRTG